MAKRASFVVCTVDSWCLPLTIDLYRGRVKAFLSKSGIENSFRATYPLSAFSCSGISTTSPSSQTTVTAPMNTLSRKIIATPMYSSSTIFLKLPNVPFLFRPFSVSLTKSSSVIFDRNLFLSQLSHVHIHPSQPSMSCFRCRYFSRTASLPGLCLITCIPVSA